MGNLFISEHPLMKHKITMLRDKTQAQKSLKSL